jgi:hypothetical protein
MMEKPAIPDDALPGLFASALEYLVDAGQRNIVFMDVMRRRGEQYREHLTETAPHVLNQDIELIADARKMDGPLALDNAVERIKGIKSEVAGRAQILVVPDLESGNVLAKNLASFAKADGAGIVLGARVPIVLTSRADSPRSRLAFCAVATLYAVARRRRAAIVAA